MKKVRISEDDFYKLLENVFLKGMDWGEVYQGWFNPTRAQTDERIANAKDHLLREIRIEYIE